MAGNKEMRWSEEMILFAQNLRKRGSSVPMIHRQIREKFGRGSYSTVWMVVRGIEIDQDYLPFAKSLRGGSANRAWTRWLEAQERAEKLLGQVSLRDELISAVSLYWAEGSKRDFEIINSDPLLMFVFVRALRRVFSIQNHDLCIILRTFSDLDRDECKRFWLRVLELPYDTVVVNDVQVGKKSGKLKYGMCRVRVRRGSELLKLFVCLRRSFAASCSAPVVQWIEQRTPKPLIHVRLVAGAIETETLPLSNGFVPSAPPTK